MAASKVIRVTVTDRNDKPVLSDATLEIEENSAVNAEAGTAMSTFL